MLFHLERHREDAVAKGRLDLEERWRVPHA